MTTTCRIDRGVEIMLRVPLYLGLSFLLCVPLAGCAERCCTTRTDAREASPASELLLPVVKRTGANLEEMLPVRLGEAEATCARGPTIYRSLALKECQCTAVRAASLGNMTDAKIEGANSRANAEGFLHQKDKRLAQVQQRLWKQSALEARNLQAALALEDFLRLAEAEAQQDIVAETISLLDDAISQTQSLIKQGIKSPVEPESLRRQRLDALSQNEKLQLQIEQLNADLRRLLGYDPNCSGWRFWPRLDGPLDDACPDADAAVAMGLAQRPTVALLRIANQELDTDTLPAAQQLLGASSMLLSMSKGVPLCPKLALLMIFLRGDCEQQEELNSTRKQLREALAEQERNVAMDIRIAAAAVRTQRRLTMLARERVQSWQSKTRELEDKKAKGAVSFVELTNAKIELLKARGTLNSEIIAWRLALLKLHQSQGILAAECGYVSDEPAEAAPPCVTGAGKTPCSALPSATHSHRLRP